MSRRLARELDLGAGSVVRVPHAIRADASRDVTPDVVLDAGRALPFRDNSLSRIYCFDLVEHIDALPEFMAELHRVLQPAGTCLITTPHFSCANTFTDPTHKHHLGWFSFDYFTEAHPLKYYSTARFSIARRILRFHGGPIDTVVRRIANRWPGWYERRLTWMFPAWYLEFELTAVKNDE